MDILRSLLNTLLLGLTLSTVILTLAVYFIYKIRLGFARQKKEDKYQLEGTYFKRIAPHLAEVNAIIKHEQLPEKEQYKIKPWQAFTAVFVTVFIFLIIDKQLSFYNIVRGRIPDKQHIDKLKTKGLLQEYEFKSERPQDFLHFNKTEISNQTKFILSELKSKTIAIVSRTERTNTEVNVWKDYLRSLGLNAIEVKTLFQLKNADIILLPSNENLDSRDIAILTSEVNNGKGLLILASSGQNPQTTTQLPPLFSSLGIKSKLNCNITKEKNNSKQSFVIEGPSSLPWSLPAGSSLRLSAAGRCEVLVESEIAAIIRSENSKRNYGSLLNSAGRVLWLNLLPAVGNNGSLEDLFWGQTFHYLAFKKTAKLARWTAGANFLISIAIVGDGDYSSAPELKTKLDKADLPFTIFLDSDTYTKNFQALFKASKKIEIASMGERIEDLTKNNLAVVHKNLQNARYETELLSEEKVDGFRVPYDKFNWEQLLPVWQNRIHYVLGTNDFSWHEPVPLDENFFYIPSHISDFNLLARRKEITSEDDFKKLFQNIINSEIQIGGHLVVRINPDSILQEPYLKFMNVMFSVLSEYKKNVYTLKDVASFSQIRRSVLFHREGKFGLSIENTGTLDVFNLNFWSSAEIESNNNVEKINYINGQFSYNIKSIPANKTIHLRWKKL